VLLLLGLAFLLVDLGVWTFWGVKWWTALILLAGISKLGMCHCKDCKCEAEGKKRKK